MNLAWQRLNSSDFTAIMKLADEAHPTFPERAETFEEKQRLFPAGALKLALAPDGDPQGYAIAYPWVIGTLPKLDTFFGALPKNADCLYLHDAVIAPAARGAQASARLVAYLREIAREGGFAHLALIAVYGSEAVWSRHGFECVEWPAAQAVLRGYGQGAKTMLADV